MDERNDLYAFVYYLGTLVFAALFICGLYLHDPDSIVAGIVVSGLAYLSHTCGMSGFPRIANAFMAAAIAIAATVAGLMTYDLLYG